MCPAVQEDQGAPTVPSGQAALGTLYLLWDLACPGLEIRGSPSLLSLREGLRTRVVPVLQGGPSLRGGQFQELLELLWDLVIQAVLGHL